MRDGLALYSVNVMILTLDVLRKGVWRMATAPNTEEFIVVSLYMTLCRHEHSLRNSLTDAPR